MGYGFKPLLPLLPPLARPLLMVQSPKNLLKTKDTNPHQWIQTPETSEYHILIRYSDALKALFILIPDCYLDPIPIMQHFMNVRL